MRHQFTVGNLLSRRTLSSLDNIVDNGFYLLFSRHVTPGQEQKNLIMYKIVKTNTIKPEI